ncbi:MAG: efflux RND transporter periplasmic adaptor subunit [Accumulibacter sp.]|jgi:Cu(I)/Ag(I) efflux system membrane fusion protein|uniref:efflux RND transporter periplasmic adaptor subunit n=1 Tax=Accumulibacter sp. TaxID=2053492 RepID=UPI002FC2F32E
MKQGARIAAGALAVAALAAAAGYWAGKRHTSGHPEATHQTVATAGDPAAKERRVLYYRNPMGLPDTSPTPKKDSMGMDYVPVYADEADEQATATKQLRISTEKVQKLGVRTEAARLRSLDRIVRAVGRIEPDERRQYAIAPKFEGYVERLQVSVTGQAVGKGQVLFEVYSPELVSAQREYVLATQAAESLPPAGSEARSGMQQLAAASLTRLRNWDISDEQIKALASSGDSRRTLSFRSPVAGVVTEKKAVQGMRFMPGETLYQVADLSTVWVITDVFEQDIGLLRAGAPARIKVNAYPDRVFEGTVGYVYPTLKAETRSVPVRVELSNPGMLLKPGMFAQVELAVAARGPVLTVPVSAVIDSGTRQIVLVQLAEGRFEPREVKLGVRSDDQVEVRDGVRAGEQVVVAANFLIDAESNLKAAVGGFAQAQPPAGETGARTAPASTGHRAEGQVESIDAGSAALRIRHGPVESLHWPPMSMPFQLANESLRKDLKPGAMISFEFVERGPGEWVITSVKPAAGSSIRSEAGAGAAAQAHPHAAHAGH